MCYLHNNNNNNNKTKTLLSDLHSKTEMIVCALMKPIMKYEEKY